MYFDLAMLTMPHYILKEKLILYHHISCLSTEAISRRVLDIQKKYNFPGLHKEIEHFLIFNEIYDVTMYSKKEWKNLVLRKVHDLNRDFLIDQAKRYKKLDHLAMACEDYKM